MDIQLVRFAGEYAAILEKWESTNELAHYLSHTRPRFLREDDPRAGEHIRCPYIKVGRPIHKFILKGGYTYDDQKS